MSTRRIQIETADLCNLSCRVCDAKWFGHIMDPALFKEIIAYEKTKQILPTIQFGYRSEFLADPRAVELSRICKPLHVVLWTNGALLRQFLENEGYASEVVISILGGMDGDYSYTYVTGLDINDTLNLIADTAKYIQVSVCLSTYRFEQAYALIGVLQSYNVKTIYVNQMTIPKEGYERFAARTFPQLQLPKVVISSLSPSSSHKGCPMIDWDVCINSRGNLELCCLSNAIEIGAWSKDYETILNRYRSMSKFGMPPHPKCIEYNGCRHLFGSME